MLILRPPYRLRLRPTQSSPRGTPALTSGPLVLALAIATFGGQAVGAGSLRAPNLPQAVPPPPPALFGPALGSPTREQLDAGHAALLRCLALRSQPTAAPWRRPGPATSGAPAPPPQAPATPVALSIPRDVQSPSTRLLRPRIFPP